MARCGREWASQGGNKGWQTPFVHFLFLPPKLFYSSASSLLYFLYLPYSQSSPIFPLTPTHNTHSQIQICVSRLLPSTLSPWLTRYKMRWVNWPFNLSLHSFLALNKLGMVRSRPMVDWGGQSQMYKVTTEGVTRRPGSLPGRSREIFPDLSPAPLLPDPGFPSFITQL